jgi:alkylated DNA repair dioxygenase AlkB
MKKIVSLQNLDVIFHRNFLTTTQSEYYFQKLLFEIKWNEKIVKVNKNPIIQKRLVAWHGDTIGHSSVFEYTDTPTPWTPILFDIKNKIERETKLSFNGVLLNLYRDGFDRIGWHTDNDIPILGINPTIASLSLGSCRLFKLRHKSLDIKIDFELLSGSLLIMKGETQQFWEHCIEEDHTMIEARIGLTFRKVLI